MKSLIFALWGLLIIMNKAEGKKGFGPGEQDWGYVTVRKGAHMFYWLYYKNTKSVQEAKDYPLVIWLQGGPGASSSGFGNFIEIGTLDVNETLRQSAWTNHVNVLFIDNPVGAGFSYVEDKSLFTRNNDQIVYDLLTFIKSFYKKHSEFSKTPLYIFSESYGGKMAIQFAYALSKAIHTKKLKINFKGIALGDSWISPIDSSLSWARFLLETGEIDYNGYESLNKAAEELKEAVEAGRWIKATTLWENLSGVVYRVTKYIDFYNIMRKRELTSEMTNAIYKAVIGGRGLMQTTDSDEPLVQLMNGKVKTALEIPSNITWYYHSLEVFQALKEDFMKPVTSYVEKTLNNTDLQVIVYSGQLDLIVATPGTLKWVQELKWNGSEQWKKAERIGFGVNNVLQGFLKTWEKFSFYWILDAGHMVPLDNPLAALKMLQQVTNYQED